MFESARARVTFRYTIFFTILVLAVAGASYGLIRNNAYLRLDQRINYVLDISTVTIFHEIVEHHGKQAGEKSIREVLATMYQSSFPQEQIVIREGKRIIGYKPSLGSKQHDLRTVEMVEQRENVADLRVAAKQVYVPQAQATYTIFVSTSRDDVTNDLASVLHALAVTSSLFLLLATAGGYLLARRTLAPLTAMASTVDAITSKNLERRVKVVNPHDELGQLAIRFNNLLERLHEAFLQQKRFMADASHELKTPIAAALTAAQVTLQGSNRTAVEYREALRIVEEQMLRLRHIVQDMFLLAQADGHVLEGHKEMLYFDEIVAEACRAVHMLAESKGVHLQVNDLPEARCVGDPGLLRQAAIVLLDNARKYTAPGGRIDVTLALNTETCTLRVADTGQGVPFDAQTLIFDRFYRVDKSRSRLVSDGAGSGAGLGLAIAKWIANIHGGNVRLEQSSAAGSIFAFEVPIQAETTIMS